LKLLEYISKQLHLEEKSIIELNNTISTINFSKKGIILEPDSLSKNVFFIEKGIARIFYRTEEKEVTLYFCNENQFSIPVDSIFYNKECKFGIQSVTDTTINKFNYKIWEKLSSNNLDLLQLNQKIMIENIKRFTDYIYAINFKTPKERFEHLMTSNPSVFNTIPLGYIASYLGITQETLSRLRNSK